MVRINWTIGAKKNLKSIAAYISRDSKRYAKRQINQIRSRTQILKAQINIGRKVPEVNKDNFRELIEGNYRIIYKIVSKNRIDILTVHHSSRDLPRRNIF